MPDQPDYDPRDGSIDTLEVAVERVGANADAAAERGMVLTARAENHLYGLGDLDDTIMRPRAYREADAKVLYAPELVGTSTYLDAAIPGASLDATSGSERASP